MPNKVLVAYTTNSGSTQQVAEAVAGELGKTGAAVEVCRLEEVGDLSPYGAVVVGGPMILGWLRVLAVLLLVPALFGIVVLLPPMTYITQLSRGRSVSFWQHYLGFFQIKTYDLAGIGVMENLNRWLWVVALLGLGHYFLNRRGKILVYLSEAAFPFYILHLPIDTLVAYFIIKLPLGVAPKYLLIIGLTAALTFTVYEALKRIAPLRFCMGLKPSKEALQIPAPGAAVPLDRVLS